MTRHPIAQIAPNGNLKSQEFGAWLPLSCEIDYFTRRFSPGASTFARFFTDDYEATYHRPFGRFFYWADQGLAEFTVSLQGGPAPSGSVVNGHAIERMPDSP